MAAEFHAVNVDGTRVILDYMDTAGIRKIVAASSGSVYREDNWSASDEESPLLGKSPYAETKILMEQLVKSYSDLHGFQSTVLRFFNLTGGCASGLIGETSNFGHHLIPTIIQCCAMRRELPIIGLQYDTCDGSAIRSFTNVELAVDAILRSISRSSRYPEFKIYNICERQAMTVLECVSKVEAHFGVRLNLMELPLRPEEKSGSWGNPDRACTELGLQFGKFDFDQTISSYSRWLWKALSSRSIS